MTPKDAANCFARAGHTIAEGAGAFWYDIGSGFFQAIPFDKPVDAVAVLSGGFLPRGAIGARFVCVKGQGKESWSVRCSTRNYELDLLGANARSKIRRGLARFKSGPVSSARILEEGHRLNQSTLTRQGRHYDDNARNAWSRQITAFDQSEGVDMWGAQAGDQSLAACLIAIRIQRVSHILIMRSSAEHLSNYVNNALMYSYLHHALAGTELDYVSFGLEPLGRELPELIHFKESMGFERVPLRQAVVLSSRTDLLLRSPAGKIASMLSQWLPRREKLAKAAALASYVRNQERLVFSGRNDAGT